MTVFRRQLDPPKPICQHCGEPIKKGEVVSIIRPGPFHVECGFRMVAGSVGHQQHRCKCYGQVDTSEVGMTRRQAAKAALSFYNRHHDFLDKPPRCDEGRRLAANRGPSRDVPRA